MIIPKQLLYPGMTEDAKKRVEAMVKANREVMSKVPTHDEPEAAIKAAVRMHKTEQYSLPSVWKEPKDIGTKYVAVHVKYREKAGNGGYTEVVDQQKIHDIATGNKRSSHDDIEEV